MRKQVPQWTSALAPFCPATLDCLGRNEARDDSFVLGGTSQDGSMGWLARGNALEVFSATTGERLAAWCFGNVMREPTTCITCVCMYDCYGGSKLIVATSSETSRTGMLCVFCIKTSKVIRAIETPCKVTALDPVCVGGLPRDTPTLCEQVKSFCGILAVGTEGGHTFLLDMCLDDESTDGSELELNEIRFISPRTSDIASVRYVAQSRRQHLALELGDDTETKASFLYRRPDSSIAKKYPANHVAVSCLKYLPETGMLAVGYTFGCFQLWRLNIPVLEYSSRYEDELAPVSAFAYQEPENDPRYFCYLWVGRGPLPYQDTDEYASTIMLFQLEFDKKTWYENLGHVFEELTSVGPRFEHELTADLKNPVEGSSGQNYGSRIVACCNLVDPHSFIDKASCEQSFDEGAASSPRLCMFAWEVQTLGPQSQRSCVLGLFDMNRWYHAQMPVTIRFGMSHEECPFFTFCSLDDVLAASNSESVVTAHVPYTSISKFFSSVSSSPYQHSYPSAMSFGVYAISESGIVRAKFLGIQRQILADMQQGGSAVLIDPTDVYRRCLIATLLQEHVEMSSNAVSLIDKREAVLSVALNHNLVGFITNCITQSTSSSDYVGTLRLVMEWAWRTVTKIKESVDTICEPLHDWSGLQLNLDSVQKLHHHNVTLAHLVTIFQTLATHSATTTEQGQQELETKLAVLILIQQHVSVVVWFLSAGLLPEYSEERGSSADQFVYTAETLKDTYNQRRKTILQLPSEVRSTDILLIDGLIATVGSCLGDLWLQDGATTPNYPPPSLHALLSMYLLEDVSLASKHHVTFYVLCDIYSTLPDELQVEFGDRLHQFGQRFGVALGMSRLLQGFWLLDHGDFEDSMSYLLDPLVSTDHMTPWQHTRVIKSLLYQGQSRLALRYVRVKTPPMLTRVDVKLQLTVLLANGLISEAFEFQRSCRDKASSEDLLSHLFRGAQQTKTVDKLLQLPFTEEEEVDLVRYLRGSEEKHAQELLVLYYLQRARFVEAVRLNDMLRKSDVDSGQAAVTRASMRNAIVDGYMRVLPGVQRRMSANLKGFKSRPYLTTKFAHPAPLSTVVHRSKVKVVTKATLIHCVLMKVQEVRTAEARDDIDDDLMPRHDQEEVDMAPDPFVGTPLTPRATRRSRTVNEIMFGSSKASSIRDKRRLTSPGSISKRRLTPSLDVSIAAGSPRINRSYGADAISLLQTPPVRRRTPASKGLSSSLKQPEFVPQSIIKTMPSAMKKVNMAASVTEGGRSGVTWPAMPELPTPPRPQPHKSTDVTDAVSPARATVAFECTPKQLRFAEPTPEDRSSLSPEVIPSSSSRVSFQNAVEHTNKASIMRSEQSPPETATVRRGIRSTSPEAGKADSDSSDGDDAETPPVYLEVDSDITFNFASNLETVHSDVDSQEDNGTSPQTTTPLYRADSGESNKLASGRTSLSEGRLPMGGGTSKDGSPGGNKDDIMEVEGDDSDVVIMEDSEQDNEFVSFLNEPSPREQSVERELQLSMTESVADSSGDRLVVTPSPRPSIHSTEDGDYESPCPPDEGRVEVTTLGTPTISGDVNISVRDTPTMSLRSSSVTVQTSLFRRGTAVSLESGDTGSPITAVGDLSSGTPRVTKYKEVYKTMSSERVASSFVLKNASVDLQTPPRPTRLSNLPLTPPLSRSPLRSQSMHQAKPQPSPLRSQSMHQAKPQPSPLRSQSVHLAKPQPSPLRSQSMQQAKPQPSPLRSQSVHRAKPQPSPLRSQSVQQAKPQPLSPRSTRSTSAIVASPSHSRPFTSPMRTRAGSRSVSPAVGMSDSPVQQALSPRVNRSPSTDRSPSRSPQVLRPSAIPIRRESPKSRSVTPTLDKGDGRSVTSTMDKGDVRSVTPTLDKCEGNRVETDSSVVTDTTSSGVRLSPAKVSVSDIVVSNAARCEDVLPVSTGSPVTRMRSEPSPLSQPSNSIERLESTLNIPKSATKAFRGSARKARPSVPRSVSKSAVKSALKSVAKSKKLQNARKVELAEGQGSIGPLSGKSFMVRLRRRPNSRSSTSPEQQTEASKDATVDQDFTFSAPGEVSIVQGTRDQAEPDDGNLTTIQPFIFSPPITRTRSRVQGRDSPAPVSRVQGRDSPAPVSRVQGRDSPAPVSRVQGRDSPALVLMVTPEGSGAHYTRLSSRRTQKQKEDKSQLQQSVTDSPTASDSVINFVSPVVCPDESGPRRRGKLVHPAGYSMTLRQKGKSKRKPLKW